MKSKTAAVNLAEIEELQGIRHVVRCSEDEEPGIEVPVVAESACGEIGDSAGRCEIVRGVDRRGVQGELIVECRMDPIKGEGEVLGFAIASSNREA